MATVHKLSYEILRSHGIDKVFGNPGSNELPFLKNFPEDFEYILALQECVVLGIADGYAQASGQPVLVNLHSAAGTGNAMGALANAWNSHSPIVVTAGQQNREMLAFEPYLMNIDATMLPRPLVKWSYEPLLAKEVPHALNRAVFTAMSETKGPVYLSIPYDDWDQSVDEQSQHLMQRKVYSKRCLDAVYVQEIKQQLEKAKNPVLVFGADVDADDANQAAVILAEKLKCPVWAAPSLARCPFPNTHPQFKGILPASIQAISAGLSGHDLILVIGAPVFRYHQYQPGEYLPVGARLISISCDANEAARAAVGEAYLADILPAILQINAVLTAKEHSAPTFQRNHEVMEITSPLKPQTVFDVLRNVSPANAIYVNESTSTTSFMWERLNFEQQGSYYYAAAGGLGFAMPAGIGIQMAQPARQVFVIIGDGSSNYSIQALWTAAQYQVPVIYIVMKNGTYGALRWFASVLNVGDIPAFDVPDIDFIKIAEGYGVQGFKANTQIDLEGAIQKAMQLKAPALIEVETWGALQETPEFI